MRSCAPRRLARPLATCLPCVETVQSRVQRPVTVLSVPTQGAGRGLHLVRVELADRHGRRVAVDTIVAVLIVTTSKQMLRQKQSSFSSVEFRQEARCCASATPAPPCRRQPGCMKHD
eukprot:608440-Rhodomonas_salina.1